MEDPDGFTQFPGMLIPHLVRTFGVVTSLWMLFFEVWDGEAFQLTDAWDTQEPVRLANEAIATVLGTL